MPKYQMVVPHDPAQCAEALDETLRHNPEFHSQVVYGCHVGDCTGYALIEAASDEEARSKLPKTLHKRARVVEVEYVNPKELKSLHDETT